MSYRFEIVARWVTDAKFRAKCAAWDDRREPQTEAERAWAEGAQLGRALTRQETTLEMNGSTYRYAVTPTFHDELWRIDRLLQSVTFGPTLPTEAERNTLREAAALRDVDALRRWLPEAEAAGTEDAILRRRQALPAAVWQPLAEPAPHPWVAATVASVVERPDVLKLLENLSAAGYQRVAYLAVAEVAVRCEKSLRERAEQAQATGDASAYLAWWLRAWRVAEWQLQKKLRTLAARREFTQRLARHPALNVRQAGILAWLLEVPATEFVLKDVQDKFGVVYQTARTDVLGLEALRLLDKHIEGKKKQVYALRAKHLSEIESLLETGG